MSAFFTFPSTPHIAWLGQGRARHDKVLASQSVNELLDGEVTVEEKVDGANLGFSVDSDGELRAQNRGDYLALTEAQGQWRPLKQWLAPRRDALAEALFPDLILFGEWCYAVHSVHYTRLPDWFLAFDVYDRSRQLFWSAPRRAALVAELRLAAVPVLGHGRYTLHELKSLLGQSCVGDGPAEGIYIRRDDNDHLLMRAKLVRSEFVQAIETHWSKRPLRTNAIVQRDAPRR